MDKEILDNIESLFFSRLEEKTGWGKNDVKSLYKDCVLQVLKERISNIVRNT